MYYYKIVDDGIVGSIGTVNEDGAGNISQQEYETLLAMFRAMPKDKQIADLNGNYEYVDRPESDTDDEVTTDELIEILLGGES